MNRTSIRARARRPLCTSWSRSRLCIKPAANLDLSVQAANAVPLETLPPSSLSVRLCVVINLQFRS
jgi:hypothetical protein